MSGQKQILLTYGGEGDTPPPSPTCDADPYYACAPAGDPHWNSVVALLNFNNDIVDSSPIGATFTNSGSTFDTLVPKFNGTSLRTAGSTTQGVSSPTATTYDLNSDDFTIEGWIRPSDFPSSTTGYLIRIASNTNVDEYEIAISGSANDFFFAGRYPTGASTTTSISGSVSTYRMGFWTHLALTRSGDIYYFFVNGKVIGASGSTNSYRRAAGTKNFYIGNNIPGTNSFTTNARFTNIRITVGVARYTANFNIPTSPFPTSLEPIDLTNGPRTVLSLHANIGDTIATPATWNLEPVNTYEYFTYSNGNKTISYTGSTSGRYNGALAYRSRISGKYYWEVYCNSIGNASYYGWAARIVAESSGWIQQLQAAPNTTYGTFTINPSSGATAYSGSAGPTLSGAGATKTYMFAVDLDTGKIWIGINGTWYGSGNPATDTSPTLTNTFTAGYPAASLGGYLSASSATIRVIDADFTYTRPSGFLEWGATEEVTNDELLEDSSCWEVKPVYFTGTAGYTTSEKRFGTSSISVTNTGSNTLNGAYIGNSADFDFDTDDFTIEMWAYRTSNAYTGTLFYYTETTKFSFVVNTSGIVILSYRSSGGAQADINTGDSFSLNTWHHIAVQRYGTNFTCYLDGTLIDTTAITGGASSTVNLIGDGLIYIGRPLTSTAENWNGYIDEIRVSKGVARYTADFEPSTLGFCDSTTSGGGVIPTSGTEYPSGIQATVSTGVMRLLNHYAPLTGQSMTVYKGGVGTDSGISVPSGTNSIYGIYWPGLSTGGIIGGYPTGYLTFVNDGSVTYNSDLSYYNITNTFTWLSPVQELASVNGEYEIYFSLISQSSPYITINTTLFDTWLSVGSSYTFEIQDTSLGTYIFETTVYNYVIVRIQVRPTLASGRQGNPFYERDYQLRLYLGIIYP